MARFIVSNTVAILTFIICVLSLFVVRIKHLRITFCLETFFIVSMSLEHLYNILQKLPASKLSETNYEKKRERCRVAMLFPALPWSPTSHIFVCCSAKPAYPLGFKQNDPTQAETRGPHQLESLRS
jgi:hypothetical protein